MGELGKRSGLAAALIAVMIAMAAMLSLAPQAHADLVAADSEGATSQYALLRSDSYLVPCDSSGVQLSDTWEGKRDSGTLDNVHTVYIASDVRIITQTHTVKYAEAYGGVDEFACTFTKAFSYNRGLPRLDEVKFLPNSRCATIGDDAFNGASYLTSVRLPNTVQRIGGRAFKDCTSLHDFSMGNSVLTIGVNAFGNCSNLTEIDLPATLTTISTNYQYGSFNGSGLKKVTVRATTPVSDGGDGRYICNAFGDTPIMQESNGAYIYVPTAALTTYRTHYGVGGSD